MNTKNITQSFSTNAMLFGGLTGVALMGAFLGIQGAHAAITSQMDFGAQGSDVSELQAYYSKNPNIYPSGLVTGYFGDLTKEGTEKFQTNQGIVSEGSPETTGFGRVGPLTIARLNSLMGGTYIVGAGDDVNAPRIYPDTVSVDSDSATISWTTGEAAKGRVMYDTSWPFLYATARSVSTNSFASTAEVTISNLKGNTTYYYVRESVDSSGNIMWTTHDTFKTK